MLFAATHPQRALGLILFGTAPRFAWAPDFPWGETDADFATFLEKIDRGWGSIDYAVDAVRSWGAPGREGESHLVEWLSGYLRRAASPGAALALELMNREIDVRHVLPAIHMPTLVLARTEDKDFAIQADRYMAGTIPGARLVEFPGSDHFFWVGNQGELLDEVERFMKQLGDQEAELDRVLATVLFTDIVGSTRLAAEAGDRRWRELIDAYHGRVRALIGRYRGREVDTAGDSFLVTFDGPIRAIRCALASIRFADLGIEIRAGLHTGEVELAGNAVRASLCTSGLGSRR